jgi:flagellar motility protein MotE (MotC chaperone)
MTHLTHNTNIQQPEQNCERLHKDKEELKTNLNGMQKLVEQERAFVAGVEAECRNLKQEQEEQHEALVKRSQVVWPQCVCSSMCCVSVRVCHA